MKNIFLGFLLITSLFAGCKKDGIQAGKDTITYEVISKGSTWNGTYADLADGRITDRSVENMNSGWKYSFKMTKGKSYNCRLGAFSDNFGEITANIYQGDKLIASSSDSPISGMGMAIAITIVEY